MGKKVNDGLTVNHEAFDSLSALEVAQEKDLAEAKLAALRKIQDARLEKKHLNATEAKLIADTTTVPIVHVYKAIRDLATEGLHELTWNTAALSASCKNRLLAELQLDGYKVEVREDHLTIIW